jgi:dTDP-4-dehydrorhamnose reductase
MITLIGHGYIGSGIGNKLTQDNIKFNWISHRDWVPKNTKVIINAAGYTGTPNVDACEINKQACVDGNVVFPLKLEQNNLDTPIVHISSGCIYSGYKPGGWTEEDEPNFDYDTGSFYSGSKAVSQQLLMPYLRNKSYFFRIRMPFGNQHHPKNLLTKLSKYEKLINYENSVSYVDDVVDAAIYFARTLPTPGIYNVCNPGSTTTKQIAELMGLEKQWFTVEEFNHSVVAPRSNCVLNTDKLTKIFPIQTAESALALAIKNIR